MKARTFLLTLASASLLSFGAFAAGGSNHSTVGQHGFGNVAGVGQVVGPNSSNTSHINQRGVDNFAVTGQLAVFGGSNTSSVSQSGFGNTAVTSQTAF